MEKYNNQNLLQVGDSYEATFQFSQEQVNDFARVSGDHNPIHSDEAYAATTVFKRPIMHGMLSASIFSKVFGTLFPGEGTIYLSQQIQFKRPMFVDTPYKAIFKITEVDSVKHKATVETVVQDVASGDLTIQGVAQVLHNTKI